MGKSLSERIAGKAIKEKLPVPHSDENQNRAVFLGLRPEIRQAINDGWPIRTIWKTLHEEGTVTFGYDSFLRYTRHLILTPPSHHLKHLEQPDTIKTANRKRNKIHVTISSEILFEEEKYALTPEAMEFLSKVAACFNECKTDIFVEFPHELGLIPLSSLPPMLSPKPTHRQKKKITRLGHRDTTPAEREQMEGVVGVEEPPHPPIS